MGHKKKNAIAKENETDEGTTMSQGENNDQIQDKPPKKVKKKKKTVIKEDNLQDGEIKQSSRLKDLEGEHSHHHHSVHVHGHEGHHKSHSDGREGLGHDAEAEPQHHKSHSENQHHASQEGHDVDADAHHHKSHSEAQHDEGHGQHHHKSHGEALEEIPGHHHKKHKHKHHHHGVSYPGILTEEETTTKGESGPDINISSTPTPALEPPTEAVQPTVHKQNLKPKPSPIKQKAQQPPPPTAATATPPTPKPKKTAVEIHHPIAPPTTIAAPPPKSKKTMVEIHHPIAPTPATATPPTPKSKKTAVEIHHPAIAPKNVAVAARKSLPKIGIIPSAAASKPLQKGKVQIKLPQKNATAATPKTQSAIQMESEMPTILPEVGNEPKKGRKSMIKDHYKHFTHITHIYEGGDGDDTEISEETPDDEEEEEIDEEQHDMSWILKNSAIETEIMMRKSEIEERQRNGRKSNKIPDDEKDPYLDIRLALKIVSTLGRLPFSISAAPGTGRICIKRKFCFLQLDFILLLLFLGTLTLVLGASVANILFANQKTDLSIHGQDLYLEKLLLQKHWLYVVVFLFTLFLAFAGGLSILFNQKSIANFFNDFGQELCDIDYGKEAALTFKAFCVAHILFTFLDCVFLVAFVTAEGSGFGEAQKFQMLLITRWISKGAWFSIWTKYGRWGLLVVEMVVYFLARNVIVLVLVPCVVITNLAENWNFRIKLLLAKVPPEELKTLEVLKGKITFRGILKEHTIITKGVRQVSDTFTTIFTVFFSLKIMGICCELFRFATAFLLNSGKKLNLLKWPYKTSGGKEIDSGISYDASPVEAMLEVFYFSFSSVLGFLVASYAISGVGETVMAGFGPIRRYGLVFAKNAKERKFILSLQMSFNGKEPHIIKPGSWFTVDRGLIAGIIGMSFLIFSVMIQCNVVNLVEVPIVVPCENSQGVCTKSITINVPREDITKNVIKTIADKNLQPNVSEALVKRDTLLGIVKATTEEVATTVQATITPTTTPTTTTTIKPPPPPPVIEPPPPPPVVKPPPPPPIVEPPPPEVKCPPPKFTPKVKYEDSAREKKEKCGFFCKDRPANENSPPPLSHIYRLHLFDTNGNKITKDSVDTFQCITNPYGKVKVPVYDCFGNCFDETDELNHFGINLQEAKALPLENVNIATPQGFVGKCYNPPNNKNPLFHSLQICGIPFPYLKKAKDAVESGDKLGLLKIETQDLHPPGSFNLGASCTGKYGKNPPDWDTNPINIPGLTMNFTYKNVVIHRMVPFSFLYAGGFDIPMEVGSFENEAERLKRLFAYPYTYIHPRYTKDANNPWGQAVGYYDCFGKALIKFDECGGLPFTRVTSNGKLPQVILEPEFISKPGGVSHTFSCYPSWLQGYRCGVPAVSSGSADLIIELCTLWQEYLNSVNP